MLQTLLAHTAGLVASWLDSRNLSSNTLFIECVSTMLLNVQMDSLDELSDSSWLWLSSSFELELPIDLIVLSRFLARFLLDFSISSSLTDTN
ncbi:hypothetical protein BpHYR1_047878 [Brachionus plicatilis]|uniref:Uncharacterized protein n=1 Tax=Brachionus plicatilis TaxID=10195 RepID=A0A3M7T8X0_BRAPC|nr:hypothetical protein BpHYR1_047878 [Brachionus plicatilis]